MGRQPAQADPDIVKAVAGAEIHRDVRIPRLPIGSGKIRIIDRDRHVGRNPAPNRECTAQIGIAHGSNGKLRGEADDVRVAVALIVIEKREVALSVQTCFRQIHRPEIFP